ncbi:hypothetical protein ScPMuIL_004175 [Solemya velum]
MYMVFYLLLLLAPLARSTPCCTHSQFEATLVEIGAIVDNQTSTVNPLYADLKVYYDYPGKQMRIDRTVELGYGSTATHTLITRFNMNRSFFVNGISGRCGVALVSTPMQPPCVPANATNEGTHTLGTQSDNILINTWSFMAKGSNTMTMSEKECSPVKETHISGDNEARHEVTYLYSDVTIGIHDMSIFNIPDVCIRGPIG